MANSNKRSSISSNCRRKELLIIRSKAPNWSNTICWLRERRPLLPKALSMLLPRRQILSASTRREEQEITTTVTTIKRTQLWEVSVSTFLISSKCSNKAVVQACHRSSLPRHWVPLSSSPTSLDWGWPLRSVAAAASRNTICNNKTPPRTISQSLVRRTALLYSEIRR